MKSMRTFLRQVGLLAGKDLKVFARDRGALLFAFVFPFVFVVMFSMVMVWNSEPEHMVVYVATEEEDGGLSRHIIDAMVSGSGEGLDIRETDPDKARASLVKEEIGGYLLFPREFSDDVISGEQGAIAVYFDPDAATTRAALMSIAQTVIAELEAYRITYEAVAELAATSAPTGTGGPAGVPGTAAVSIVYEEVGKIDPPRPVDFLVPSYLTMFVFFSLAMTAETLVAEKEDFTLERLVSGTATRSSLVAGKLTSSFVRGLIQAAVFWVAGLLIFNVRMGHYPWTVVLVSVLLALAASGVGVFLATVAKTRRSAGAMAVLISLSFAAFGGSWWPLFIMPVWLQNLARITPHAWANSAFNKLMLFGASPASVVPEITALAVFAVTFFGLAVWRFKVN